MANTLTVIKRVEFIIEDELTHCNIFYESSESGNPFWGGGWKTRTYPKTKSIRAIMNSDDTADYILWNDGRSGVDKE